MGGRIHRNTQPFNDAFNYRSRAEKELFNKLFLRTESLDQCLESTIFFLMGEKGSGKTAYAVYLENNSVNNNRCQVTTMTETQYSRFIKMKRAGKLAYSDYSNIWRSILLYLMAELVVKKSKTLLHKVTGKFSALENEIKKWSKDALNPEIESAFNAITSEAFGVQLGQDDVAKVEVGEVTGHNEKQAKLRHHLLETENSLKSALSELKLPQNHVLFIDGIDYRPESVPYKEYLECIKGLAEAVWQLNTEFFNSIRDSKGRMKQVLLVRPDVFHALNLYNSNSRLQDNTVYLDWATNESEYKSSPLFEVSGRYFSRQQVAQVEPREAWDHYYSDDKNNGDIFKKLLRQTFQKPRDLLTFIKITRSIQIKLGKGGYDRFVDSISSDPKFSRAFSDYLLGETRNYAAFYMTQKDFQAYIKFFQYLDGKRSFSYEDFQHAFEKFTAWAEGETIKARHFLRDPEALLQFFYDVNVVGYRDLTEESSQAYYHWSYRERSLNNISPKVKATSDLYINPGIAKALDIGKSFKIGAGTKAENKKRSRRRHRGKPRSTRPKSK